MLLAINPDRIVRYVPRACRDAEGRPVAGATVFLLGAILAQEMAEIEDALVDRIMLDGSTDESMAIRQRSGTQKVAILRAGLRGWEGFKMRRDADGAIVDAPFDADPKSGRATDRSLSMLDPALRLELANAITDIHRIAEDDHLK